MEITFTGCIDNVYDDVSISFNACGTEDIKFFTVSDTIDINNKRLSKLLYDNHNNTISISCITFDSNIKHNINFIDNKKVKVHGQIIPGDKFIDIFECLIPNYYNSLFWVLVDNLEFIND